MIRSKSLKKRDRPKKTAGNHIDQLDDLISKFFAKTPETYCTLRYNRKYTDLPFDWHYSANIQHESDYVRNCSSSGCSDEGICRCGKYENFRIESFDINTLINTLNEDIIDELLQYCIDRIVRLENLSTDSFDADINSSYYGEEIDGIYLNAVHCKSLSANILKLKSLSNINRIKFVLELEYGYLLDSVKNITNCSIEDVDIVCIQKSDHYIKKVNLHDNIYNENFTLPRAVLIKHSDYNLATGRKLIDGYHRVLSAQRLGMTTIRGIVLY